MQTVQEEGRREKLKWLAALCMLGAAGLGFSRYRIGIVESGGAPSKLEVADTKVAFVAPPALPAADFLKFDVVPSDLGYILDIADDGTSLWLTSVLESPVRRYAARLPDGRSVHYDSATPDVRHSLSDSGRIFQFKMPARPGMAMRRPSMGSRVFPESVMSKTNSVFLYPRRFTNAGEYISIRNKDVAPSGPGSSGVGLVSKGRSAQAPMSRENAERLAGFGARAGAPPVIPDRSQERVMSLELEAAGKEATKLYESKIPISLVEHGDKGSFWVIEWASQVGKGPDMLTLVNGNSKRRMSLPGSRPTVKFLCQTGDRVALSLRGPTLKSFNKIFDLKGDAWVERVLPKGYLGGVIQKITMDGLEFGHLEDAEGQLYPVVWKGGRAFDLRRVNSWPNFGEYSYVAGANRRGDLLVGTVDPVKNVDPEISVLRRLTSK